ncbi:Protein Wnt-6 [Eumeta japonica]|uniref:Protein Wnt n=1 Tax=Eumeta variegata TaxID=151549 RepID=A0A4C1ZWM3_EUMVA|nr:Protein Wnt-6 [Eumeta japonica]
MVVQIARCSKTFNEYDTRETGFVNAITAAGVAYAITRACTAGALLDCSCEKGEPKTRRGRPQPEVPSLEPGDRWQWGGCSDNVKFGIRKSREFMDSRYRKRSDIKTLIKLHNNNAGRLAIKSNVKMECKCHGLSGSCTLRTCWSRMPSFREVGDRLRDRFEGASKAISRGSAAAVSIGSEPEEFASSFSASVLSQPRDMVSRFFTALRR